MRCGSSRWCLPACALLFLSAAHVYAEQVQWRQNYQAALREAKEKNRPVMANVGTVNCYWCKQLDAKTFRDPGVVKLLNERFIPLKVDAEHEPGLAQSWNVRSYPTMVFIKPDGRVSGSLEGFVEAARFAAQLERAIADCGAPATPAPAIATKSEPQPVAAAPLPEPAAPSDAFVPLKIPSYEKITGQPSGAASDQKARQARELLARAQSEYNGKQYIQCLEDCRALMANHAGSAEALELSKLSARIKSDPELMRQICAALTDQLAEAQLELAETCLKRGQPKLAVTYLEMTLRANPGTKHAQVAETRLAAIRAETKPAAPTVRAQSQ